MTTHSHLDTGQCLPRDVLQAALSARLDLSEQASLEQHLASCEDCRLKFERLAGEASFWQQTSETLKNTALETAEDSVIDRSQLSSVFMQLDPTGDEPEVEFVLQNVSDEITRQRLEASKLLDPPHHPEMLGRIDGFNIEQMIGRGGMGVVYKGFDSDLNRPVAIKFLSPHLAASGVARKRFAREARAAAAVMHPNVVPIHSVNASSVRPYLVMAMVPGMSLQKYIEDNGPLPVKDVIRIGQQVAAGLAAAHAQGLVHRDIKPANILLGKDVSRAMITDFGLARAADDAALTQSGWLAGTPHYMSPEQAMGNNVDPSSDLFSLGSVMYFMATGREPFRAEKSWAVLQKIITGEPKSARSINSDVPLPLEHLIQRLMEHDPECRFSSATEAQETMQDYLAHLQNPRVNKLPKFERSGMDDKGQGRAFSWRRVAWVTVALAVSIFVVGATIDYIQVAKRRAAKRASRSQAFANKIVSNRAMPIQSFNVGGVPQRQFFPATGSRSQPSVSSANPKRFADPFTSLGGVGGNDAGALDSFATELKTLAKDVERLEMRLLE